ncbi:DUF4340 domain-containing protein [Marinoscillum pacificum]|uniref:DUF4340 domain-containing protein n=1 Tax=Marinoscillum pacificum TaxID=392723 RepID=UPI0021579D7C|nr:DUF4340 domain-containing protein [Marinoscillum pacificum]
MMKGNKPMLLLGVLVVLVGIYLVVKFTDSSGRSKSFRSELVSVNDEAVTKLEIMSPSDTTVLEKNGESWKVNGKYVADPATVSTALKTLQLIKPSRLASRSEDSWKDFQVDNTGTRVVAYEGGDKTLDIILGRFDMEGQRSFYSYVRLSKESDVYVAKDFMKMSISTGSKAYRNDDILKVNKDSLMAIQFNYPDSAFSLTKTENQWLVDDMPADSAAVAGYLNGLRFVTSRNFVDNPDAPAVYNVVYETASGEQQLTAHSGGGLSSSSNKNEYWVDPSTGEKIFKSKAHFLGQ